MTTVGTEAEGTTPGKADGPGELPTVRVSRMVSAPVVHVWEVLVSPAGSQALLGEGAVLGGKGEPYHCADGSSGVLRSYHPLEQLRVSWHGTPDGPPSIVEVDLRAEGDGATVLDLTQNHLWPGADVDDLQRRWSAGLERVAGLAESSA